MPAQRPRRVERFTGRRNTGLRDANLCGLQWKAPIAELNRSVFVIPAQAFKSRRAHVVIWSIIETPRGKQKTSFSACG
jgi:hypothetical protein